VFVLSFAPFGPALTLAPRFPNVRRTPGRIFVDFLNPHATRSILVPTPELVQLAGLELTLLDPQKLSELGFVTAHFVDEAVGVLA
jgi:hypothetical protein